MGDGGHDVLLKQQTRLHVQCGLTVTVPFLTRAACPRHLRGLDTSVPNWNRARVGDNPFRWGI